MKLSSQLSLDERNKDNSTTTVLLHSLMWKRKKDDKIMIVREVRVTGKAGECHLQ